MSLFTALLGVLTHRTSGPVIPLFTDEELFTVAGSYDRRVPPGVTALMFYAQGAGGGGGGGTAHPPSAVGGYGGAGGGGESATTESVTIPVTPGDVVTVVVGAGGAPGTGTPGGPATDGVDGDVTQIFLPGPIVLTVNGGRGGVRAGATSGGNGGDGGGAAGGAGGVGGAVPGTNGGNGGNGTIDGAAPFQQSGGGAGGGGASSAGSGQTSGTGGDSALAAFGGVPWLATDSGGADKSRGVSGSHFSWGPTIANGRGGFGGTLGNGTAGADGSVGVKFGAPIAPAVLVQTAHLYPGNVLAFPAPVTLGNLLLCCVGGAGHGTAVNTVASALGNTFSEIVSGLADGVDGSRAWGALFAAPVTVDGAETLTWSTDAVTDRAITILEYSGVGAFDVAGSDLASSTPTTVPLTLAAPGLVVLYWGNEGVDAFGPLTADLDLVQHDSGHYDAVANNLAASAGANAPGFTVQAAGENVMLAAAWSLL